MAKREYVLERWFVNQVDRMGGLCLKMDQFTGIPDRLVLFPQRRGVFVELKTEVGKLSPAQIMAHKKLRRKGFTVYVANTKEQLGEVLNQFIL